MWAELDCLLPWTVDSFTDAAGAANYYGGRWRADAEEIRRRSASAGTGAKRRAETVAGLGAVVWPGSSRAQQRRKATEYNAVPRRAGMFLWEQCRRAVREGALFLLISSFDEVPGACVCWGGEGGFE